MAEVLHPFDDGTQIETLTEIARKRSGERGDLLVTLAKRLLTEDPNAEEKHRLEAERLRQRRGAEWRAIEDEVLRGDQ